MNAPKVRKPRIFEEICAQIRGRISAGMLKPGDKLPSERELSSQFGTSRPAVREALRSLEMAGLIELRKGVTGGAFIREGDPTVVTQSIRDMLSLGRIPLQSLTETRVIIQEAVIRLACERGTPTDFDALVVCVDKTETLTLQKQYDQRRVQLVEFYRILSVATHNEVMIMLVDSLTQIVLSVLARLDAVPRFDTVKAQRQIIARLRERDANGAAILMSKHLKAIHAHLLEAEAADRARSDPAIAKAPPKAKRVRVAKLAA